MTDYGDFLYSIGLVNSKTRDLFRARQKIIQQDIDNENWIAAFKVDAFSLTMFRKVLSTRIG